MLRIKAYAKINLSLKILGKRPDGYHEIESVMQSVSLCDVMTLEPIPSGIQLVTNNLRLTTNNKNLAYLAAELFLKRIAGQGSRVTGVKIYLEKNIPIAAGLAGGSADAAAVLYGLNQMMTGDRRLVTGDLLELGVQIGSDVPFCLVGGNCTVKGRGEIVKRNILHSARNYVLVIPEVEVSTKWAYEAFDQSRVTSHGSRVLNDLEPVVVKKYPVIQEVKEKLLKLGCISAQMSGSGPSVFGMVKDVQTGEKIAADMKKDFPRSFLVSSVDRGVDLTIT